MKISTAPSVAAWVIEGTKGLQAHVGGFLPGSFTACALVVHSSDDRRRGSLSISEAAALASVLYRHTATPMTCYFGLWEGWGRVAPALGPTFVSSTRVMSLWEGSVTDAALSFEAPPGERLANLWWPSDHAWFVVSEIDLRSTIVGGSRECIDAILHESALTAVEIDADLDLASLG